MDLSFTTAAGLASAVILGSESREDHDRILLSEIRDSPKPGGPGPHIYIPKEQGGQVIPPGTAFPFRRLLRLAGLRCRYSTPPLRGTARVIFVMIPFVRGYHQM
jgi:hypothetical protein